MKSKGFAFNNNPNDLEWNLWNGVTSPENFLNCNLVKTMLHKTPSPILHCISKLGENIGESTKQQSRAPHLALVHRPDRVTVHPPRTVLDRYQKSIPSKKNWDGLPVLGHFQNDRHRNLEITFCAITWVLRQLRVTKLVSMHIFLGLRNSIMPIKNVSVLWKIYKQLFKHIFRAFSVIFCVSPWARKGYCAPSIHESLRPSFCFAH